jgi:hypothetical protein
MVDWKRLNRTLSSGSSTNSSKPAAERCSGQKLSTLFAGTNFQVHQFVRHYFVAASMHPSSGSNIKMLNGLFPGPGT